MKNKLSLLPVLFVFWLSCSSSDTDELVINEEISEEQQDMQQATTAGLAAVTEVEVSGGENEYTFNVTISSPDLGCQQYADWWEVIDVDGNLLYRRILTHSHVDEQPFARSGGPVAIAANTEVYVRGHMNTTGYGNSVFKGTITDGLVATTLDTDFALSLSETNPLPTGCAF